jgi:hypothetical protein
MSRRVDLGPPGSTDAKIDGSSIQSGVTVFTRLVPGGFICGVWASGSRMYDVRVFDAKGRWLGTVGPRSALVDGMYRNLLDVLDGEGIHPEAEGYGFLGHDGPAPPQP